MSISITSIRHPGPARHSPVSRPSQQQNLQHAAPPDRPAASASRGMFLAMARLRFAAASVSSTTARIQLTQSPPAVEPRGPSRFSRTSSRPPTLIRPSPHWRQRSRSSRRRPSSQTGAAVFNMPDPTVNSWSLGIQHDLGKGLVIEAAYVGNNSHHANGTNSMKMASIPIPCGRRTAGPAIPSATAPAR